MKIKDKVVVVTGAASGIGKALATRLAQDGASVVIPDLKDFETAAADIARATGARTLGLKVDVSSEADVARMAASNAIGRSSSSSHTPMSLSSSFSAGCCSRVLMFTL